MTTRSRLSYQTFQSGNGSLSPSGWTTGTIIPTWSVDSFENIANPSGNAWTDNGNGSFSANITSGTASATQTLRVKMKLDNPNDVFQTYQGIDKDRARIIIHNPYFQPNVRYTTGSASQLTYFQISVSTYNQWNGSPPSPHQQVWAFNGRSIGLYDYIGYMTSHNYIGQDVLSEVETNIGTGEYGPINISSGSTIATQRPFEQFSDPDNLFIEYRFGNDNNSATYNTTVTVSPKFNVPNNSNAAITYYWYAGAINIDGQDGDSILPIEINAATNFIAQHKFFGESAMATQTTLTEASKNRKFCPAVTMSAGQATMSVTPSFKIGPSITKSVNAILQATTENFVRMDALTMSAGQSTMTTTPAFKLSTANLNIAAQAQTTFGSNMIYDVFTEYTWDSFNLNTYFELGYAQGQYALEQGEYTWDFTGDTTWDTWASVTWIGNEESWDNWPEDVWDRKYKIRSQGALTLSTLFKVGQPLTVNSQIVLASTPGFNIPLESTTIQAQSAVLEARATGRVEASITINSVFANATVAAAEYGPGLTVAAQITSTFIGNTITDTTQTLASQTVATFAGLKRKPGEMSNTVDTTTDFDPNIIYDPTLAIAAITVKVTTTRIIYQGDPYYLIKVPAENRQLMVPVENRITLIEGENRVNMIKADTRTVLVPEETRSIKLRIPPLSNRISTPRVRSEA